MASPETIGHGVCANCGERVHVKKNKNGYPYYRCGECDEERRQHSPHGTRKFLEKVALRKAPESEGEAPEKAAKSEAPKTPQKKSGFAAMLEF